MFTFPFIVSGILEIRLILRIWQLKTKKVDTVPFVFLASVYVNITCVNCFLTSVTLFFETVTIFRYETVANSGYNINNDKSIL